MFALAKIAPHFSPDYATKIEGHNRVWRSGPQGFQHVLLQKGSGLKVDGRSQTTPLHHDGLLFVLGHALL